MEKTDQELAAEFGLSASCLTPSAMDGNVMYRERLEDVYDEISLCRGTYTIGTQCEDEEIENNAHFFID